MVTVLEDIALRVEGLHFLDRAARGVARTPEHVVIDLSDCSLAEGLWTLPAIDAIAAASSTARFAVLANDDLTRLLVAHLRARGHRAEARATREQTAPDTLCIELSPRPSMSTPRLSRDRRHIVVPSRTFARRQQHAWGHWVDGARACGFDAIAARPKLTLGDTAQARAARQWLRARFGRRGRTLVALLPSSSAPSWGATRFAEVGKALTNRLGAVVLSRGATVAGAIALDDLDVVATAHVLACVAVAVGDGGLVHVAAAVGAPAISLHGDGLPSEHGAASALGAALSADRCHCAIPTPTCLACIPHPRVVAMAEQLAGQRWPWDRLAQAGLRRDVVAGIVRSVF